MWRSYRGQHISNSTMAWVFGEMSARPNANVAAREQADCHNTTDVGQSISSCLSMYHSKDGPASAVRLRGCDTQRRKFPDSN